MHVTERGSRLAAQKISRVNALRQQHDFCLVKLLILKVASAFNKKTKNIGVR